MSWLNIDDEMIDNVEDAKVGGEGYEPLESGVYKSKITQAYLRKTDSGAVMFELEVETDKIKDGSEDREKIYWSTCVVSGDEKGNKSTYTDKQGAERPLPGVTHVKHLFDSVGLDMKTEKPEPTKVKRGDNEIDAKVFKSLTGKMFTACARQYENEYNGEISIKVDIENFLDLEGKNKKGEFLVDKFKKKIEKSPIKLLKKKAAPTTQENSEAAAASGW